MAEIKTAIIYFSATDVTRSYARVIQQSLMEEGCQADLKDVTGFHSRRETIDIKDYDSFIFGFPVFSDFAPVVINEWLPTLKGNGRRAALFLTYGARTCGYAHFHTKLLLEKAGFQVLFSAEFLGRHSFNVGGWNVLPDRPDKSDFQVAGEYARLAKTGFTEESPAVFRLQKPFGYNQVLASKKSGGKKAENRYTLPFRDADECSKCRKCETECPNQAFNAETGRADPQKCIDCMHCVYICPEKVIKINSRMKDVYQDFLDNFHLTEEMTQAKKSRIITEFRQASC